MLKRVAAFLALVLGLLGVVACCAGVYAVWLVGSRLERANETVFAAIDRGLAAVEDRVRGVRQRVAESKITTSEVTQKLREWTTKKGKDRLVARFEVESRTEKLAGNLHMADVWLGTSAESVRDTQRLLELGQRLGAGADPASLDEVLERLLCARGKLQEAERAVVELREFATGNVGESEESRLARAAKILARILVTLGEVEPRLEAKRGPAVHSSRRSPKGDGENGPFHCAGNPRELRAPRLDQRRPDCTVLVGLDSLPPE